MNFPIGIQQKSPLSIHKNNCNAMRTKDEEPPVDSRQLV